jgi:bacterioferritin-associated ferredoxin
VIVCHCRVVSDGALASAVRDGARSLSEVCRRTGAATDCGTCIFSVKQVVCEHQAAAPVEVTLEDQRAAS